MFDYKTGFLTRDAMQNKKSKFHGDLVSLFSLIPVIKDQHIILL